jgi:hypothetical protein
MLGRSYRFAIRWTVLVMAFGYGCSSSAPIGPGPSPPKTDVIVPDTSGNQPPVLHKVGDKIVAVGTPLVIQLQASDLDSDLLTYSVYGDLPQGSTFLKLNGRFEWMPQKAGDIVFLTFVVSDGQEVDRETVQITVVSQATNHPPVFQKIGDQVIEAGATYVLQLQASDLDGNPLIFGVAGELPVGASLDPQYGLFTWTPAASQLGEDPLITFSVSDAEFNDEMAVQFYVVEPGQNQPPYFIPTSTQVAYVDEPYTLVVSAVDPEGDGLTFALESSPPKGAQFDAPGHLLSWVPVEEQAGKVFTLSFSVTDGTYTTLTDIDISVQKDIAAPGDCTDDVFEPNNYSSYAKPITVSTYKNLSICDTAQSPIDADWYSIPMLMGQTLSVTLTFAHEGGDIDLSLYLPGDPPIQVATATSPTDNEWISYKVPADGIYLIHVYGVGKAIFSNPYQMDVSTQGTACVDDIYEQNDTFTNATVLGPGDDLSDLVICPGDFDVFSVELSCGQSFTADITFENSAGDLELFAYASDNTETPMAQSTTDNNTENVAIVSASVDQKLYIKVEGHPPESTANSYVLKTSISGGASCTDDAFEPNDVKTQALLMNGPTDQLGGLSLCCSKDWFYTPLELNEGLSWVVKFSGSPNIKASLLAPDGLTVLAGSKPDPEGIAVELTKTQTYGNHYLVVEGEPGVSYSVELLVVGNDGCKTSKACVVNTVCQVVTGACVSDVCSDASDCPAGQEMPCLDATCMDGCTYDSECRLGYRCKGFETGRYCGPEGTAKTGDKCTVYKDCAGPSSCVYQDKGGYCSNIGCLSNAECPSESDCVQFGDKTLCGKTCQSNQDCRTEDGFTCQPKTLVNGIPTQACLPTF